MLWHGLVLGLVLGLEIGHCLAFWRIWLIRDRLVDWRFCLVIPRVITVSRLSGFWQLRHRSLIRFLIQKLLKLFIELLWRLIPSSACLVGTYDLVFSRFQFDEVVIVTREQTVKVVTLQAQLLLRSCYNSLTLNLVLTHLCLMLGRMLKEHTTCHLVSCIACAGPSRVHRVDRDLAIFLTFLTVINRYVCVVSHLSIYIYFLQIANLFS